MERIKGLFWLTVMIVCFIGIFYDVSWEDGDIFPEFKDEFPEWSFGEKVKIMFACGFASLIMFGYMGVKGIKDFFKD